MEKEITKMIDVANKLDWNVKIDEFEIMFSKFSPAGQDFCFTINNSNCLEEIIDNIKDYCDSFDCSEETYLWLDNMGHGTNGAPYDMKDLYEDIEACLNNIEKLYEQLEKIEIEEEKNEEKKEKIKMKYRIYDCINKVYLDSKKYYVNATGQIMSVKGFCLENQDNYKIENNYLNSLLEIDNHIRSTKEPIPYIVKTLNNILKEYS